METWEKHYSSKEWVQTFLSNPNWAKAEYKEACEKLRNFVWVANYPSMVSLKQGFARSVAKTLNLSLWKTFPNLQK